MVNVIGFFISRSTLNTASFAVLDPSGALTNAGLHGFKTHASLQTGLQRRHLGDCQNYGPFLGPYYDTGPNLGDPKRDHNFDNPPFNAAAGKGRKVST